MKSENILGLDNSVPVLLYDISLPLEDRVKNVIEFPSIAKATRFLGYKSGKTRALNSLNRVTSKLDGKVYAIRFKSLKK